MENDTNSKYILVADNSTWMSVHKGAIFAEAAKRLGYKTIRVAPEARFSWQEDVFILDSFISERVLTEKLKRYKNQIAYIFPTFDFAATQLAFLAQSLEIPYLSVDASKGLSSKNALAHFLERHSMRTPRTWLADCTSVLDKIPDDLSLVVKANISTGSLRKHNWDYRIFSNKKALLTYLRESHQLDAFLTNNQQAEGFQSVIQEYIEGQRFLDVHVIFGAPEHYEVYLVGEFFTHYQELHIVESKSAILSESLQKQIADVASFFSKNGCSNMLGNLQFVVQEDEVFLFDFNLRVAGIWSYLHKIMMPDFPDQVLSFFAGKSANFKLRYPFYLKTPFYLESGRTIESIEVADISDETVLLAYIDHLVPGYTIPLKQNSIQPAPQIFAIGNSEQDCRKKIQSLLSATSVQYEVSV